MAPANFSDATFFISFRRESFRVEMRLHCVSTALAIFVQEAFVYIRSLLTDFGDCFPLLAEEFCLLAEQGCLSCNHVRLALTCFECSKMKL